MKIKRGDTLRFIARLKDPQGNPVVVDTSNMKCQIRTRNDILTDTVTITETDSAGEYLIASEPLYTSKYPITELYSDIQISDNGIVVSTATFLINVEKDITHE